MKREPKLKSVRRTVRTLDMAHALGISIDCVRQLDDVLKPDRSGSSRRYDPARFELIEKQLAKRRNRSETRQLRDALSRILRDA